MRVIKPSLENTGLSVRINLKMVVHIKLFPTIKSSKFAPDLLKISVKDRAFFQGTAQMFCVDDTPVISNLVIIARIFCASII